MRNDVAQFHGPMIDIFIFFYVEVRKNNVNFMENETINRNLCSIHPQSIRTITGVPPGTFLRHYPDTIHQISCREKGTH